MASRTTQAAQDRHARHQELCPDGMWVGSNEQQQKLTPWFKRLVTAGVVSPDNAAKVSEEIERKRKREGGGQKKITKFFTNNSRKKKSPVVRMNENDIQACLAVEIALKALDERINPLARKDKTVRQFVRFTKGDLPKITALNLTKVDLTKFPALLFVHLTGLGTINIHFDQLWDIPRQWAKVETNLIATPGAEDDLANLFRDVVLSQ